MILATKLFLPNVPAGLIHRTDLLAELDRHWRAGTRLFLCSATAGYGKTTLMSSWIAANDIPAAWVSLDSSDNDPAQFFTYLVHALEPLLPGLIDSVLPALGFPQATRLEGLLVEVINRAARASGPVLFVLDDYHVIQQGAVHALIQYLVDHLPPQLRLAVLSRADPPLALPKLRARRQILELRDRQLRLTRTETASLLAQGTGTVLDDAQLQAIDERAEGWAAALQLASLSMRDHPDPAAFVASFSGSDRFVLDYLTDEVLEQQPEDLRTFLLQSAVLERFGPALCDAALERSDSLEQLRRIEAGNLFLIPLDPARTWFRYHHLLTDALANSLDPGQVAAIRRRAAVWFETHGEPFEAVKYAIASGDACLMARTIQRAALPAVENGLLASALGWFDALPEDVFLANYELVVIRIWFLVYAGRTGEAGRYLQHVQAWQAADLSTSLRGMLLTLQCYHRLTAGGELNLAELVQARAMIGEEHRYFLPLVILAIGQAQRAAGLKEQAEVSFREGIGLSSAAGYRIAELILRNNLAFMLYASGRIPEALEICREGVSWCLHADGSPNLLAGIPYIPLGCILYELGETEQAYPLLTQSLNFTQRLGLYEMLAAPANQVLVQLLADQGQVDEALALAKEVRRRSEKIGLAAVVKEAEFWQANLYVRQGRADQSAGILARYGWDCSLRPPEHVARAILAARVAGSQGEFAPAAEMLASYAAHLQALGWPVELSRTRLEQARLALRAGDQAAAVSFLRQALGLVAGLGLSQMFVPALPELAPLLRRLRAEAPAFVDLLLAAKEPARAAVETLIEPPGEREIEILRLVAGGCSNQQIAERLYLTVGTVKWYLNQLFGKLAVNRRTEAVAKALELGLI